MTLEILDWHDGSLLAKPVFDALNALIAAGAPEHQILGVTINSDEESDTDLWCPRYGIPFENTGNVVITHTHKTRKAPPQFAAALVTGDTHADLNGVVKHTLEVSKVSFAPIDAAVAATGMESDGMSPIGLPADWPLLIDQHILSIPRLYLGSGIRQSKLVIDGALFDRIPNVQFVSGLGRPRQW
ncbi:YbaK/prolyl-tRNA synthetase associated region [Bifidobacterium goeldii]|uniref:YbaK/prolyl-tRNA synthetase associated region n=1 Tax=Bifidobacterium goeldii TaxID=2306975 RepID=A0A430FJW3_9BIFI|nr:YbaK/EbsC family protein [Bifidobacterium goeldii]RSX53169.1 YbaK/prolyl-tRNA synthetase associated region [Bifidobacterium goeldii]